MNIAVTTDRFDAESLPKTSEAGPAPKRVVVAYGFWIFLLSDIVMFSALFAGYVVLMHANAGGPTGAELFNQVSVAIETACLLASSYTCGLMSLAINSHRRHAAYLGAVLTFVLGAAFLARFQGRCLNTHPALLPSFPGMHGVRDALEYGVKVTGCTVFLVDEGVDAGPVLAQACVPVADDDDEATLHERIKVAERALLVDTVGKMAREGWSVTGETGRKVRIGS